MALAILTLLGGGPEHVDHGATPGSDAAERFVSATHAEEPAHLDAASVQAMPSCPACLLSKTVHEVAALGPAGPLPLPMRKLAAPAAPAATTSVRLANGSRAPPPAQGS